MCIIVAVGPGKELPDEETLELCWKENPDFNGYMYVNKLNRIKVEKFATFHGLYSSLQKTHPKYGKESPFVIHFRLASKGGISIENTHPFYITPDLAYVHNGTVMDPDMDFTVKDKDMSDTRQLNEYIFKHLPEKWEEDPKIMELLDNFVEPSRLCFLRSDRKLFFIGEKRAGAHWNGGVWYSKSVPMDYSIYGSNSYYGAGFYNNNSNNNDHYFVARCEGCDMSKLVTLTTFQGMQFDLCRTCKTQLHNKTVINLDDDDDTMFALGHFGGI